MRLLVSIWVKTLSTSIVRIATEKRFSVKNSPGQEFEYLATCQATTVVMEACGGAHFMVRKLLELGHTPKLISPQFVRPFVKSNKNDFVDAEAICEAAARPSMRFVQPRTESQQAMHALHRVRESLVRDKVKTTNQMHAFLLEFGVSAPKGPTLMRRFAEILDTNPLPPYLIRLLQKLREHYEYLIEQIKELESQLKRSLDEDTTGRQLLTIPCVGPLTASLLSTQLGDGKQYGSSRDFAASTGLVPRQHSTGGRTTLLGISNISANTGVSSRPTCRLGQGAVTTQK